MYDNWNISKRINAGFAIALLTVVGVAGFAFFAVWQLGATFSEYRSMARETILVNEWVLPSRAGFFEGTLAVA